MSRGPGNVQQKVLLFLLGGASLAFASFSSRAYFRTLRSIGREFSKLNQRRLTEAINALYQSKLVGYRESSDGTVQIVLNDAGKQKALTYRVGEMRIPVPARWDRKWRIITFDIPHSLKQAREAFRFHLKRLGFHQFQKSVFVFPYECKDEIEFLIELHDVRPFVRQITAMHIDNELHLKTHFDLL